MISVTQYKGTYNITKQSFACSNCGKIHTWKIDMQQSPYQCFDCHTIMPDITKLVKDQAWRKAYHQGGSAVVKCGGTLGAI